MERKTRLPGEANLQISDDIQYVVFGMGRFGRAVYDAISKDYPGKVLGVELEINRVHKHVEAGRTVVRGDATNPDFWSRAPGLADKLHWAILALPRHPANVAVVNRLREIGFKGQIATATRYPEDIAALEKLGVRFAFDVYTEAGIGIADDLRRQINSDQK